MTSDNWSSFCKKKWVFPSNLETWSENIKKNGQSIATLNGSFDLLHAGHLEIIFAASQTAEVLIVALNSDSSIQQYKSKDRPIIPLQYRLEMLSALEFVDYVTWFEELNPIELLKKIKPHVHVNGAEYGTECIEADTVKSFGGEIKIIPLIPGLSTSHIINKVKGCAF